MSWDNKGVTARLKQSDGGCLADLVFLHSHGRIPRREKIQSGITWARK